MTDSRPAAAPSPQSGWQYFVDGVRIWIPRESPADSPRHRASRARKALKRLGLHPGPMFPKDRAGNIRDTYGVGFNTGSLAPLWRVPVDLEARAAGRDARDLLAVVEALEVARGRVTSLELAADLLGYPAGWARQAAFPSIDHPHMSVLDDMLRLRGTTRRHGETVDAGRYERRSGANRNLVQYTDRPSKLDLEGPPVLHVELRLRGAHLPKHLRDPRGLLKLVQPLVFLKNFAPHVTTGDRRT